MSKDEANKFFQPASECKKLAGEYIVWKIEQTNYYVNPNTPNARETRYCLGLVSKKQKDTLITSKFDRVPLRSAYVVSIDMAAKWPQWDDVLGNKKITRSELMAIVEAL
jgi:hypothetical protein